MLVSGRLVSMPSSRRPSASRRALTWSSSRRSTWWSSAYRDAAGALDEVRVAGEDGADRGAEALGEAQPDGAHMGAVGVRGGSGRDHRVEEPRAVHVDREADRGEVAELLERHDRPAREVVGL